jgi:hypothetical protein
MLVCGLSLFYAGCATSGVGHAEPEGRSRVEFDPVGDLIDDWYDKRAVKQSKRAGYSDEQARQRVFEDNLFNQK